MGAFLMIPPPPYFATEEQMTSYRHLCEKQDREMWLAFKLGMAVLGVCLTTVVVTAVTLTLRAI